MALYIQDADGVLRLMGYVQKPDDAMLLTLVESVDRDQLLELAFTLSMLQVECDIYGQLYDRMHPQGHTMAQVHESRCVVGGGIDECEGWIRDRYGHSRKTVVDVTPLEGKRTYPTDVSSHRGLRRPVVDILGRREHVPYGNSSTAYPIAEWMKGNPIGSMSLYDTPVHAAASVWTDEDDIYAPMTADQHRMRSYFAVRPAAGSFPTFDRQYVEFQRPPVGIAKTAGSTGSVSMDSVRHHTDAPSLGQFPRSFAADEPCQQHDGLTTSRSRDAVNAKPESGVRTQPDTFTAKRFSFYDNVDSTDAGERACPTRESPVGRQTHTGPNVGSAKRAQEMTLL